MNATEKQWEALLASAKEKVSAAAKKAEAAQASQWKAQVAWA